MIRTAQSLAYKVTLLFIWLDSPKTAIQRVAIRVEKGGHNIPQDVVERRYYRGISNLITLFVPVVDTWMIVNSTNVVIEPIAEGGRSVGNIISNDYIWGVILDQSKVHGDK